MSGLAVALVAVVVVAAVVGAVAFIAVHAWRAWRSSAPPTPRSSASSAASPTGESTMREGVTPHDLSFATRWVLVGLLALGLLVPLALVSGLVSERSQRYREVLHDIASTWGHNQLLQGPILVVPFVEREVRESVTVDDRGGRERTSEVILHPRRAAFLPVELSVDLQLDEEERHRGIYKSLVYTATAVVEGSFPTPDVAALSERVHEVRWDQAYLVVGLTDTRAIHRISSLGWNGSERAFDPGTQLVEALGRGFHAAVPVEADPAEPNSRFRFQMEFNGSESLRFTAFGVTTTVKMRSSWPHPSFQGSVLPEERTVSGEGFEATWQVPSLARNYPQEWVVEEAQFDLAEFQAGVDLYQPVSLYSMVTRAVKYGVLFIGLTFLTFAIFEFTVQERLHLLQYCLVGFALCLFYLVLLSLAEHLRFGWAYFVAALLSIAMISLYVRSALHSTARAVIVFALLAALYTLLFSVLQLEDYALLMGTALLVVVTVVLMVLTRRLGSSTPS